MIYALFGYHIVFGIQHVLRFVNNTGVHGVVINYIFFSALLHCCQIYLLYIIYFSVGLLKFVIYVLDTVFPVMALYELKLTSDWIAAFNVES